MKNAYKSELDPNNKQSTAMRQHVGAARWAYNWGLERIKQAVANGERWPSAVDLHREGNKLKGPEALPWGYAVSKCAFQEALRNLQAAVDNWRASKKGERKGPRMEFPKRKTRKHGLGACRFTGTIKVFDGCIQLPRIGVVRLKEHDYLPTDKRITQATIRERAGRWFVSVLVEEEAPTGDIPSVATEGMSEGMSEELIEVATETVSNKATSDVLGGNVLGVDVGIKTLATCSDGTCYANPKALAAKIKQLRRWQRRLSRRVKGGKNRSKVRMKVARLHMQVANVRRDAHNKAARAIIDKRPSVLVIEDLNVKGMFKNRRLARALAPLLALDVIAV